MTHPRRFGLLLLFLFLTLLPRPGAAFFQKTTVEGVIGSDISGVWLAVQHLMPTFRVRLDRVEDTVAPFKVGPISEDLALLMGEDVRGVVVTEFYDPALASRIGVFPGDVITKLNVYEVVDVASFEKALKEVKSWFLVTVRRSKLQFTHARLIKIKYEAVETEVDGVSQIGAEDIKITVNDVGFPFAGAMDQARKANKLYLPSAKDIEALKSDWYKLPTPAKPTYISAEHRVVAASDYDAALRKDENLNDTHFALVMQLSANPLAGATGKTIGIYGAREITETSMRGSYVESTLASAPFPISIEFGGTFSMIKIDDFSNKDIDYIASQRREEAIEEYKDIELAPDVPADIEPND